MRVSHKYDLCLAMNLRPALLPALGVFAAAARHQNFAHAAEELHLTASAVSHHIRRLEAMLGVVLFQRHARGVKLTLEGRQLADAASSALTELEGVAANLRHVDGVSVLRLTTLHSFAYCWLIPRLPRFTALHPQIRLQVDTGFALTRFDDGGPDLGIRHGPGQWPGLTAQFLMDDELFPVASPTLTGVDRVQHARDIARLPLVTDLAQQGWREWFRTAGVRGLHLPEMHSFRDSTDAMQAAVHGVGAVLARRLVAQPYLQQNALMRLSGPALKSKFSYYAVYPAHKAPRPAAVAFVEWLRSEVRDEATNAMAVQALS